MEFTWTDDRACNEGLIQLVERGCQTLAMRIQSAHHVHNADEIATPSVAS